MPAASTNGSPAGSPSVAYPPPGTPDQPYDYDWIVIGSGFGGSVAALRLAEKGYRVAVLEAGRRFEDHEYAESAFNLRRMWWAPRLGCKGILRLRIFKDVTVLAGAGVGGGSLIYMNVMYRPPKSYYADPQWAELQDWESALEPHYEMAEKMLGAATVPFDDPADRVLRDLAAEIGVLDSHRKVNVAVYFGDSGRTVDDPYFGGEGPPRRGCIHCGKCYMGCAYNAKNTLVKNYLYLAERRGARIFPERTVMSMRPVGGALDGALGYEVTSQRSGAWLFKERQTLTARGVVLAAGALGTNELLLRCKASGALSRLSDRVGGLVRTNSEAIMGITAKDRRADYSRRVNITGSIFPDRQTHIETVVVGDRGNLVRWGFTLMTGRGTRLTRPFLFLAQLVRHPLTALWALAPFSWGRRTILLLVMQTVDNRLHFRPWRVRGLPLQMQTEQDAEAPNPTYIDQAHEAAERIAARIDGFPLGAMGESLADIPLTAHILGGAVIGKDATSGVIDAHSRVFGYQNLLVTDGAALPANPGVNPSLSIAALAEHALSHIPRKEGAPDVPPVKVTVPTPPSQGQPSPLPGAPVALA